MKAPARTVRAGDWRFTLGLAGGVGFLFLLGCSTQGSGQPATSRPVLDGGIGASASQPSTRPAEMPGVHNVLTVSRDLWSGSSPEGDAGFESLARLGVKTIISVDGARPQLDAAQRHGMRYVHIPVGYDGIPAEKQRLLARTIRDLPGPVYVHCHHGKHRGPAAAASAAVLLGLMPAEQGVAFLKRAGTADMYTGLYGCVRMLKPTSPAELDAAPADFPEVARVSGFVAAMVRIDEHFEHLQLIQQAGWKPPADHPDLVPQQEAQMLAELLAGQDSEAGHRPEPEKFTGMLRGSARLSTELVALLASARPQTSSLDEQIESLRVSCRDCHKTYRDHKP